MRRGMALLLLAVLLPLSALAFAGPAVAAASGVQFQALLDGRSVDTATTNDPLVLQPGHALTVRLAVTNDTPSPVTISAARIEGRVMGLTFFSFDTQINLQVAPSATERLAVSIGLGGLSSQADGLLPSTISLLDQNDNAISSKDFSVDVKGNLTSIYGIFGLAVAAITAIWLISLIYRVATRALPENRWRRALQFSAAGFGVGLVLTFTVSALRLLTPNADVWAPFVFGAGLIGLIIGYFTPGPRVDNADEDFLAEHDLQPAYAHQWAGFGQEGLPGDDDRQGLGAPAAPPAGELESGPAPAGSESGRETVVSNDAPWGSGPGEAVSRPADPDQHGETTRTDWDGLFGTRGESHPSSER